MYDAERIRRDVAWLRERKPWAFGAVRHRYLLNPPASEASVERLEADCGVRLPEEYRDFITSVADGGAGPVYGLQPLAESVREFAAWWFDDEENQGASLLSAPFRPPGNLQESRQMADEAFGWLPLVEVGCGAMFILIVSGPERGNVWVYTTGGEFLPHHPEAPSYPANATIQDRLRINDEWDNWLLSELYGRRYGFREWYLNWLDNALAEAKKNKSPPTKAATPTAEFPYVGGEIT